MKNILSYWAIVLVAVNCTSIPATGGTEPPYRSNFISPFITDVNGSGSCANHGTAGCASAKDGKEVGIKTGIACTYMASLFVLPLFQIGDMSLKHAARMGGIEKVTSIDYSRTIVAIPLLSFLPPLYAKKCIIVNGK